MILSKSTANTVINYIFRLTNEHINNFITSVCCLCITINTNLYILLKINISIIVISNPLSTDYSIITYKTITPKKLSGTWI